jgi:hypothetical protein
MRLVKHGLLLVGVFAALAAASVGGTFQTEPSVSGDTSADGTALAHVAGLHW